MEELNNIELKFNDILSNFKNSYNYKNYLSLKTKMENNTKINELISDIKNIQKEIVKKEYNKENIDDLEKMIENDLFILNQIPLYVEYNKYQNIINDELSLITEKINKYIENL